jgi:serine phosphatase RsbU (regulator of sigma subunit)
MALRPLSETHIVVKLNYVGRLIVYTVELLLAFSVFYHYMDPWPYWMSCIGIYLFWPTSAFLLSANSNDQKRAEHTHILFESLLVGCFFVVIKFDPWACLGMYAINVLFYTMIGGPRFFIKSLGLTIASTAITVFFFPDFRPRLHSSIPTIIISNALVLVSIAVMGISAYMTNKRLSQQRRELKEKQEQIISSLKYARTIQNSLMAVPESIKKELPGSFVIWEPRDIVGGDIYYTHFSDEVFIISVVDCTGHGVPGALLSMVASSILQRIVRSEKLRKPSEILKRLDMIVRLTLDQDSRYSITNDGMDVGICVVDRLARRMTFSGARIPLLIVHDGVSKIIKGSRSSIGYRHSSEQQMFTDHEIGIEKGMAFYLFSDGITGQTGGEKGIMFGIRRLRSLIENLQGKSFDIQKTAIMEVFSTYQSDVKRKDDITMVGFSLDEPEAEELN